MVKLELRKQNKGTERLSEPYIYFKRKLNVMSLGMKVHYHNLQARIEDNIKLFKSGQNSA